MTTEEAYKRWLDLYYAPYERRMEELRANPYHDSKGRFTFAPGSSKRLDKGGERDIMKLRINLFDKSDPLYYDAFSIEEEDGYKDVCIHGSSNSVQKVVNGKRVNMDAKTFAEYLKENGYKGENIRLASCSTGFGENSFAQQLSKELNVTVKAPDKDVYYIPKDGVFFVGSPCSNTGKWRIFKNGVEIK